MIVIRQSTYMHDLVFSTTKCPFCEQEITFFELSPVYCKSCSELMPNFMDLIESVKDRITYTREGLSGIT